MKHHKKVRFRLKNSSTLRIYPRYVEKFDKNVLVFLEEAGVGPEDHHPQ